MGACICYSRGSSTRIQERIPTYQGIVGPSASVFTWSSGIYSRPYLLATRRAAICDRQYAGRVSIHRVCEGVFRTIHLSTRSLLLLVPEQKAQSIDIFNSYIDVTNAPCSGVTFAAR